MTSKQSDPVKQGAKIQANEPNKQKTTIANQHTQQPKKAESALRQNDKKQENSQKQNVDHKRSP